MAADTARAESLAQDLGKRYPLDTQMQSLKRQLPPDPRAARATASACPAGSVFPSLSPKTRSRRIARHGKCKCGFKSRPPTRGRKLQSLCR